MHIGLIGGIGPAATDYYYRGLIEGHAAAGRALIARGAEAIILGGTDLFLAFDGEDCGFATLDCARVHVEAILARAFDSG
jgi:aspartate/glutamate racemase